MSDGAITCPICRRKIAQTLPSGHVQVREGRGDRSVLVMSGYVLIVCGRWNDRESRYCQGQATVNVPAVQATVEPVTLASGSLRVV